MNVPIIVDQREKKPYDFPGVDEVEERRLETGDYTLDGFEDRFAIERKTLDDLANSIGTDRNRFENEIRRANGLAHRNEAGNPLPGTKPDSPMEEFVVMIEADQHDVYKDRNTSKCEAYWAELHPNSFIGTVEKWPNKYPVLEFVWAGSRQDAMQETLRLLDQWYIKYRWLS